ncbi:hypothetical protein EAH80_21985 [Mycobacterium hodleri]|uniref:PE domain-containing protein n=1 Tax=Mycolicibacterium hodleri TaxID=49897 RepID=A0A502E402_9MYCO|nr:hypothetical protein EAH80_21985 [Mycolicibacterium hodleri]
MDPMHTPGNLNWNPASVDMPEIPMLPPGEDAMSMTISGVLPTLTAPMAASVAALQAKETMFSGKLGAAQSAYQNADDSGGQSVGQFGQMLGQLGQMAGQAGAPAQQLGQQAGQFGSMMQQAMQAAQGGGSQGGRSSSAGSPSAAGQGQPSAGQGAGGAGASPQQARADGSAADHDQKDRDAREPEAREGRQPLDAAAPGATPHGAGPAPVAPPRHGDGEDLARRV